MTVFHPHQKSNAFEMGHFSSLTLINSFNGLSSSCPVCFHYTTPFYFKMSRKMWWFMKQGL